MKLLFLLFFLIFSYSIAIADKYTVSHFTVERSVPQRGNDIIEPMNGKEFFATEPTTPEPDRLYMRRKYGTENYGFYKGNLKSSAFGILYAFQIPEMSFAQIVSLKYYDKRNSPFYLDIVDVYFDETRVYVPNRQKLFYYRDGQLKTIEALKELPSQVRLISDPPGASIYSANGKKVGICPKRLTKVGLSEEFYTFELDGYYKVSKNIKFQIGEITEYRIILKKVYLAEVKQESMAPDVLSKELSQRLEEVKNRKTNTLNKISDLERRIKEERIKFVDIYPALAPKGKFEKTIQFKERKEKYESERKQARRTAWTPLLNARYKLLGEIDKLEEIAKTTETKLGEREINSGKITIMKYKRPLQKYLTADLNTIDNVSDLKADLSRVRTLCDEAKNKYIEVAEKYKQKNVSITDLGAAWYDIKQMGQSIDERYQARIREVEATIESHIILSDHYKLTDYNADSELYTIVLNYDEGKFDFSLIGKVKIPPQKAKILDENVSRSRCLLSYRKKEVEIPLLNGNVARFFDFQSIQLQYGSQKYDIDGHFKLAESITTSEAYQETKEKELRLVEQKQLEDRRLSNDKSYDESFESSEYQAEEVEIETIQKSETENDNGENISVEKQSIYSKTGMAVTSTLLVGKVNESPGPSFNYEDHKALKMMIGMDFIKMKVWWPSGFFLNLSPISISMGKQCLRFNPNIDLGYQINVIPGKLWIPVGVRSEYSITNLDWDAEYYYTSNYGGLKESESIKNIISKTSLQFYLVSGLTIRQPWGGYFQVECGLLIVSDVLDEPWEISIKDGDDKSYYGVSDSFVPYQKLQSRFDIRIVFFTMDSNLKKKSKK